MSKLLKAFLVVAVLWLVVVGLAGAAGFALFRANMFKFLPNLISVTESVQRDENLTHNGIGITVIDVRTHNGAVVINGTDNKEIDIMAHYVARAGNSFSAETMLRTMGTRIAAEGNVLRVEGDFGSNSTNNQTIWYSINVPKDIDVIVRTTNGSVKVYDVSGKLRLDTSNGLIEVISEIGPEQILAKTSNGKISITGTPEAQGVVYDLRTSNGAVTASLPLDLGINVIANTSNGSINLGSGQWTFDGGQISTRSVRARRGSAQLELIISTSNGNIRIEDK